MHDKGIIIGITGGIAAYKACELIRLFVKDGFRVFPVMTRSATKFITPLTIVHLSSHKVYLDMFEEGIDWDIEHVELVRKADAMLVAPATANIIAKIATGIADDFVSLTALTFAGDENKPLIIAPAMNFRMYRHPATRKNLETLKNRGVVIIEPETGELACGESGEGRLASVDVIFKAVLDSIGFTKEFKGKNIVITAGGTREPVDPVRFIGNRSSGKMGYALATEFKRRGANVTLISSSDLADPGVDCFVPVETVDDLRKAVRTYFKSCDILVMAAAVSDFAVKNPGKEKIRRSSTGITLDLVPTEDIVADLAKTKGKRIIVGFAAEDGNIIERAGEKLKSKNLDMIVANDISRSDIGFSSDYNEVFIITGKSQTKINRALKSAIACEIVNAISSLENEKGQ